MPMSIDRCWPVAAKWARRESVQCFLLFAFAGGVYAPNVFNKTSPDEIGQFLVCQWPVSRIVTDFATVQNHPLFSLSGHFALVLLGGSLPDELYACRLMALSAGMATPLVFYATNRNWLGSRAAMIAGLVLTVVDPVRYYATAARGYAWLILCAVVLNAALVQWWRNGGIKWLIVYFFVAVAGAYTHLWAVIMPLAHGLFVGCLAVRDSSLRRRTCSFVVMLFGLATAIALAYRPMMPEILAMTARTRSNALDWELAIALVELLRFSHWTVAACIVLVPATLIGFVQKPLQAGDMRLCWLHATIVFVHLLVPVLTQPDNFGSRFLVGMTPSLAALFGWCVSGTWGMPAPRARRVSLVACWLLGLSIGWLFATPPPTYSIPWVIPARGLHTVAGANSRVFVRDIGVANAGAVLFLACVWMASQRSIPTISDNRRRMLTVLAIQLASAALGLWLIVVTVYPLIPSVKWLFDLHKVPFGTLLFFAWHFGNDADMLRRLRAGLVLCALTLAAWRMGFSFDARGFIGLIGVFTYVPAAIIVAALRMDFVRSATMTGECQRPV